MMTNMNKDLNKFAYPTTKQECIAIDVVGLHFSMIILKYDLHESKTSVVYQGSANLSWCLGRPRGEIKRVNSLEFVLINKS